MYRHMHGVLVAIEIFWVAGFLAIFVVYFLVKAHFRAKKRTQGPQDASQRSGTTAAHDSDDISKEP